MILPARGCLSIILINEYQMISVTGNMDDLRFIKPGGPLSELARRYLTAMLAMERNKAGEYIEEALDGGESIADIYLHVFQPVQFEIGWLWQNGVISVGREHYCTNATQRIMAGLYPRLFKNRVGGSNVVLVTCVDGELHELGLRMLADFFEMDGWDAHFLGASTPDESVVSSVQETEADLLAVGVTMHYGVENAKKLIDLVRSTAGLEQIPVMVGGYTFLTVDGLWQKVGADGTAPDARQALVLGAELVANRGENG